MPHRPSGRQEMDRFPSCRSAASTESLLSHPTEDRPAFTLSEDPHPGEGSFREQRGSSSLYPQATGRTGTTACLSIERCLSSTFHVKRKRESKPPGSA